MATIDEKLEYLLETKNLIKQAIIDKGVDLSNTDVFRDYVEKINNITTSGDTVNTNSWSEGYWLSLNGSVANPVKEMPTFDFTIDELKTMLLNYDSGSRVVIIDKNNVDEIIIESFNTSAFNTSYYILNVGVFDEYFYGSSAKKRYDIPDDGVNYIYVFSGDFGSYLHVIGEETSFDKYGEMDIEYIENPLEICHGCSIWRIWHLE